MDVGQLEMSLVDDNRPAALVSLLTNPAGDGPAKILAEGGTSMWEQWDPGCSAPSGQAGDNDTYDDEECNGGAISQTASDSMSHGWGSVGVYFMTRGLLGITPTGIGESGVTIAALDSGLAAAQGRSGPSTAGAGAPRYEGTRDGGAVYTVGSGTTVFVPVGRGR